MGASAAGWAALLALFAAPALADDGLDMNRWEDVVTLRLRSGDKLSKDCSQSWCDTITTSKPDQYGTVRLTVEATGSLNGRWECSIDRRYPDLRSCNGFWPEQPWRLDERDAAGRWHLVKVGTFEEVNALEEAYWHQKPLAVPEAPTAAAILTPPAPHKSTPGDEVPLSGLSLPVLQKLYLEFDDACRGGPGGDTKTDDACGHRQAVSRAIYAAGYCIAYPQYTWHRCRPGDTRPW